MSVSDLAGALQQSEPRVSRHLRILCEAGLLERFRQGQWVHYGLARAQPAVAFVRGVLAQIDRRDELLARTGLPASPGTSSDAAAVAYESRLGRALGAFVQEQAAGTSWQSALLIGVAHLELIDHVGRLAGKAVAIADSRRGAQAARAFVERVGSGCRIETAMDPAIDRPGAYDAIIIDHLVMPRVPLAGLLARARPALRAGGTLFFFERYDALDGARERIVEHPLARVRRVLAETGFSCRKLNPIEADGEHVLAASADVYGALSARDRSATAGVA